MDNVGYQPEDSNNKERKETFNREKSLREAKNQKNAHFNLQDLGSDRLSQNEK